MKAKMRNRPQKNRRSAPSRRDRQIRYAVMGLGYISQIAVLPAFANAKRNSKLAALISDDSQKLKNLGAQYGVEATGSYDEFEDCLQSNAIDAVYIALPNSMHREFTVRAARAGVHVLCEKPMAVTESECEEMIRGTERAGVLLMIAYRLHFDRANLRAVEIAQSGKLGELRLFDSVFTMQVKDRNNIRLKADLGGGPLYDIGIYCINAARSVFRSEPIEVCALSANNGEERFRDVDEMTAAVMRYPKERLATFSASFGASDVSSYRIVGTKGNLVVEPAYEYSDELGHCLRIGERYTEKTFAKSDQFGPELTYFSDCILSGRQPEPSAREGLADVRIIRALLESAKSGRPVSIEQPEESEPMLLPSQAVRYRPIDAPDLYHAKEPS
jgi:glucose-fructose oxidoreductase